jgi:flagellar basal-body rod protein FlgF
VAYAGLYTAMAGLETASGQLATIAQNVANANTVGYSQAETAAMALPYQGAAALPGADVTPLQEEVDTRAGAFKRTGGTFDVAVHDGWLLVQTPSGGLGVTRDGALAQGPDGVLVTESGAPVLDANQQPISLPPLDGLTISSDGSISGIPAGSASQQPRVFGQLYLAATPPAGAMTPIGDSIYALQPGAQPTTAANATTVQGTLEESNVDPVSSMVGLISEERSFSLLTQTISKSGQVQGQLDQIMTTVSG